MSTNTESKVPHIVVVGTGFGGLEAAFNLRNRLGARATFTIVSKSDQFHFKPNTIYIPFGKPPEAFVFPLRHALERRGVAFVRGQVDAVDPVARTLTIEGTSLGYDYLVLATGAAMRPSEVPGLEANANTIWSPDEMMRLRGSLDAAVARAREGKRTRVRFVVPPNNKCSGPLYEMVLMLDTWLRKNDVRDRFDIGYSTYESGYIQAFGPRLNTVVSEEFEQRGIEGRKEVSLVRVEPGTAHYADGSTDSFDLLIAFPPYVAATRFEGLPADDRGFLHADLGTRQLAGHPDIYVVGDAADFPIKQAFLALLQADAAAEHLASRILGDGAPKGFDPVSMCIMEQFDKATFAQVPLRLTGNPAAPVAIREDATELYKVGSGPVWRIGKKMLGAAIPMRFTAGQPFHAGASWAVMEAGVNVMARAFAD